VTDLRSTNGTYIDGTEITAMQARPHTSSLLSLNFVQLLKCPH
jgi:pSer/pThr/pTyr-binding forkhead associated (FHA) protein